MQNLGGLLKRQPGEFCFNCPMGWACLDDFYKKNTDIVKRGWGGSDHNMCLNFFGTFGNAMILKRPLYALPLFCRNPCCNEFAECQCLFPPGSYLTHLLHHQSQLTKTCITISITKLLTNTFSRDSLESSKAASCLYVLNKFGPI